MTTDQARSIAFGHRLQQRMSTRVESLTWGTAYFDDDFPLRYGSNFVWVDGVQALTADRLAAEADRLLGGAGFDHRVILVDPPEYFEALRPGFVELGWAASQYVLMVLRRKPTPPPGMPAARVVKHPEIVELLENHVRAHPGRSESAVRTLADYPGKLERQAGARLFMAEADGVPAASCELYLDGPEAQVESVQTLEEFRGRGLGRAVVMAAIADARQAGAEWIHLYAEANDWPAAWYHRLGFEEAGSFGEFALYPTG